MGTLLNRGIASFKKKSKEREAQFVSRFVYLRDDGERARIRFLTDADDFVHGVFHRPFTPKPLDPILCFNDSGNPGVAGVEATECRACEIGDKTARQAFFSWVYVKYILHPTQNPRLEEDAEAPKWEVVKVGSGKTMYKQNINAIRMLNGGKKMLDSILALYDENGSLLEGEFSFIRNGARKSTETTYSFVPTKAVKADEKEVEQVKALTSLEDAALIGTQTFYAGSSTVEEATSAPAELEEEVVGAEDGEDFADI